MTCALVDAATRLMETAGFTDDAGSRLAFSTAGRRAIVPVTECGDGVLSCNRDIGTSGLPSADTLSFTVPGSRGTRVHQIPSAESSATATAIPGTMARRTEVDAGNVVNTFAS